MEFSGLLALDVDALGRPTGMKAMTENDVILSSVLPENVRDATREVEDSSSTWEAGGDPQIAAYVRSASGNIESVSGSVANVVDGSSHWFSGYNYGLSAWETVSSTSSTWVGGGGLSAPGFEDWNNAFGEVDSGSGGWNTIYGDRTNLIDVSARTNDVRDTSGNWNTIYNDRGNIITTSANTITNATDIGILDAWSGTVDASTSVLDGRVDTLDVWSGTVDASTIVLDGRVDTLDAWSGTVDASTIVLDGSTTALNVWSGTVDASTSVLDGRVDVIEPLVPSATGFANWNTIYRDRGNIITTSANTITNATDIGILDAWSGTVDTSTATLDGRVDTLDVWSGTVDTSTATLDGSTTALNVWSGTVDTSTSVLDGRVDVIEPLVPSATGFAGWNSTKSTVDAGASNWDTIYNDRTNIRSVSGTVATSGTAFLTGATPTLSNDLNANGNSIRGANLNVCSTTGDLTLSAVAGSNIALSNDLDADGNDLNNIVYVRSRSDSSIVVSGGTTFLLGNSKINYGNVVSDVSSLIDNMANLASVSATGGNQIDPTTYTNGVVYWSGTGTGLGFGATPSPGDAGVVLTYNGSKPLWGKVAINNVQAVQTSIPGTGSTLVYNTGTGVYDSGSHGDISGLGDDDHPQYLLADSSRAASGNFTIDNYNESPPSNPVALVLKTIDSVPTNETAIGEIRFAGNNATPANKVYNRLRGVSNDVAAGSEDGSIQLRHLLAGSEVISLIASGGGVTVEESLTVSTCPVPAPVCYAQMDGDGTAATSETKFGAGVTPTTVTDSTGHITWDNTNKEFDISVAGTYHVLATLNINVAATTLPTIRIKNGATAKNSYVAHGIHSAEKPEEVTIQAAFTCAASDSITVTFQDDAATNINLVAGSSVTVRRLF